MSVNKQHLGTYPLTTSDVAREYEYSIGYVRSLATRGEIPYVKVGRGKGRKDYRFNEVAVAEALAGRALELANRKAKNVTPDDDLGV
jgi:hypothetical protein